MHICSSVGTVTGLLASFVRAYKHIVLCLCSTPHYDWTIAADSGKMKPPAVGAVWAYVWGTGDTPQISDDRWLQTVENRHGIRRASPFSGCGYVWVYSLRRKSHNLCPCRLCRAVPCSQNLQDPLQAASLLQFGSEFAVSVECVHCMT